MELKVPHSDIDYDHFFKIDSMNDIKFSTFSPGDIFLPTGKIVVADPFVELGNVSPLNRMVYAGKYPVVICCAELDNFGTRYAFARINFTNDPVTSWPLAYEFDLEDEVKTLKENEFIGIAVEAGLACFCDAQTQELYSDFVDEFYNTDKNANIYDDYFADLFKANANKNNPDDIGDFINWKIPKTDHNVIMFQSGYGDGYYPVYWGLDSQGKVASLVIDFELFGDEDEES